MVVAPSLVPLAVFAALLHLGALAGLLPRPRAALDADRTILLHQAEASRLKQDARVLLLGDSSCLMDVSAPRLTAELGAPVLNLGTLSYLDLYAYASLLRQYVAANPRQLSSVVLLMHPEALRRPGGTDYHAAVLRRHFEGRDFCGPDVPPALCALGVEVFRGRLLSRVLPQPLEGALGREYGFTWDLWDYLTGQRGSALDPGTFDFATARGNAEYRLAKQLEPASAQFRAAIPAPIRLLVGITPVPESFAGAGFAQKQRQMLAEWGRWLQADAALTNLPSTLPDGLFASATHLKAEGVGVFSEALGKALAGGQ